MKKYYLRLVDSYVSYVTADYYIMDNEGEKRHHWQTKDDISIRPLDIILLKFKIYHKVYMFEVENNIYMTQLLQFLTEKAIRPVKMTHMYRPTRAVLNDLKKTKMDIELKELQNFMVNVIRSKRIYELKK